MARDITAEEKSLAADMLARARAAMAEIADYDQAPGRPAGAGDRLGARQRDHVRCGSPT